MPTLTKPKLEIKNISVPGYHKVVHAKEAKSGLECIIAIHNTTLGKEALGGTRIFPYASFDAALTDVLRLSKGMTCKSAITQCPWGGGKSVIIADPKKITEEQLAAFAEVVNSLKGEYICAEDVGCSPEYIGVIAKTTPYAVGIPSDKSSGNPSPFTAWGVFRGIQAACNHTFGTDDLTGKTVAVQGLGSVGSSLCEYLFWHGARLVITDIDQEKLKGMAKKYDAKIVAPEEIFDVECDIFAPCAMGGIINDATIERLKCKIVAGAANNQLLKEEDAETLYNMGILYAPDFVINAGGLINVTAETVEKGYNPFDSRSHIDDLYDQLKLIFDISKKNEVSTQKAVMQIIDYRLQYGIGKRTKPIYMHHANMSY